MEEIINEILEIMYGKESVEELDNKDYVDSLLEDLI